MLWICVRVVVRHAGPRETGYDCGWANRPCLHLVYFRDMQRSGTILFTIVFPELRERVEQLGLEFFDVDLRSGVPTKYVNGETANSREYCRQWIDRVEPFFVCILCQRCGWVPEPQYFRMSAGWRRR